MEHEGGGFALPYSLSIAGKDYAIDTDWRTWVRFSEIAQSEIGEAEKVAELLLLCFGKVIPDNLSEAVRKMMWFYARGKPPQEGHGSARRVFDLRADAGLLCAAFFSQYRIDLREGLHWWQFWELFEGLHNDEKIVRVIGWRGTELSKIKDKEQRRFVREMQRAYRLPDGRTEAERDAAVVAALECVM